MGSDHLDIPKQGTSQAYIWETRRYVRALCKFLRLWDVGVLRTTRTVATFWGSPTDISHVDCMDMVADFWELLGREGGGGGVGGGSSMEHNYRCWDKCQI